MQLAQSISRAAAAIRRAESAVATHGNGSEGAEVAYDEAAEAVNQFLEADALLHPTSSTSSSNATPMGKGTTNLGLDTYRDFVKGKGKSKGKTSPNEEEAYHTFVEDKAKNKTRLTSADWAAENGEGFDLEADPADKNYKEKI